MQIRWLAALLEVWRRHCRTYDQEVRRLARMYRESEQLRAELSHLEHRIYGIREAELPRRHKALLEAALRSRLRRVEAEMLDRQNEVIASGHVPVHW